MKGIDQDRIRLMGQMPKVNHLHSARWFLTHIYPFLDKQISVWLVLYSNAPVTVEY